MNTSHKPDIGIYIIPTNHQDKGTWIDLSNSLYSVSEHIQRYLSDISNGHTENGYRVQDKTGFYDIPVGEFEDPDTIQQKANLTLEFGELASHVYLKRNGNLEDVTCDLNNSWGSFRSFLDFGEWLMVGDLAEEKDDWYEGMALPDKYSPFVDTEAYARHYLEDFEGGSVTLSEGKLEFQSHATASHKGSGQFKTLKDLGEWLFVVDVSKEPDGWYDGVPLPVKYRPFVDFRGYATLFFESGENWSTTLSTGEYYVFWEFDPA